MDANEDEDYRSGLVTGLLLGALLGYMAGVVFNNHAEEDLEDLNPPAIPCYIAGVTTGGITCPRTLQT